MDLNYLFIVSRNYKLHTLRGEVYVNRDNFNRIKLGFGDVGIFDRKYDRGIWQNEGIVKFGDNIHIGHGVKIVNIGKLILGNNLKITANTPIISYKKISIRSNTIISWENLIMDTDFHKVKNSNGDIVNKDNEIIIGSNVWIGCRCSILKGEKLPDNSVIAANSVINKDLSNNRNSIIVNNRIIKDNISWER